MEVIKTSSKKIFLLCAGIIVIYIVSLVIFMITLVGTYNSRNEETLKMIADSGSELVEKILEDQVVESSYITDEIKRTENCSTENLEAIKKENDYYEVGYLNSKNKMSLSTGEKIEFKYLEKIENIKKTQKPVMYADKALEDENVSLAIIINPIFENGVYKGSMVYSIPMEKIVRDDCFTYLDGDLTSTIISKEGLETVDLKRKDGNNYKDLLKIYNNPTEVDSFFSTLKDDNDLTEIKTFKIDESKYKIIAKKMQGIDYYYIVLFDNARAMEGFNKLIYLEIFIGLIFIIVLLVLFKYISDRGLEESNLINKLVYKDSLTLISTENRFILDVENVLKKRPNRKYAIVYFDVDNFTFINETYGYEFGNTFLCKVAQILVEVLGEKGIYARARNDNFIFFYEIVKGKEEVEKIINLIRTKINTFAVSKKINFAIRVTNGIFIVENVDGTDNNVKNMILNANSARNKIKMLHKEYISYYDAEMKEQLIEEKDIAMILLQSLENKEFIVYYQPKVDSRTQSIIGAEALIRWNHPTKGIISPAKFIPIAERTHDIVKLDQWVFKTVCYQIKDWIDKGQKVVPISVNVSRIEVYESNFLKYIDEVLEETKIPTDLIEIELTETVTMKDTEFVTEIITELKKRGLKVLMDDFGTGYSSLACLKNIKMDVLKIDRSFVIDIEENEDSRKLVKAVIYLAKNLNMLTVCEGVESIRQVQILKELGCNVIQGYVFFKPLELADFENAMKLQELRDKLL